MSAKKGLFPLQTLIYVTPHVTGQDSCNLQSEKEQDTLVLQWLSGFTTFSTTDPTRSFGSVFKAPDHSPDADANLEMRQVEDHLHLLHLIKVTQNFGGLVQKAPCPSYFLESQKESFITCIKRQCLPGEYYSADSFL